MDTPSCEVSSTILPVRRLLGVAASGAIGQSRLFAHQATASPDSSHVLVGHRCRFVLVTYHEGLVIHTLTPLSYIPRNMLNMRFLISWSVVRHASVLGSEQPAFLIVRHRPTASPDMSDATGQRALVVVSSLFSVLPPHPCCQDK